MDPREIHEVEQMQARIRDLARTVAAYRQELIDGGVPEPEAWASAQELQHRAFDLIVEAYEARRDAETYQRLLDRLEALTRRGE